MESFFKNFKKTNIINFYVIKTRSWIFQILSSKILKLFVRQMLYMWHKKNLKHLILHCKNTKYVKNGLKKKFNIKEFSLKNFFNIKIGQEFLFKFIEKT